MLKHPLDHPDERQVAAMESAGMVRARTDALQRARTAIFDALRFGASLQELQRLILEEVREATQDDPTPPDERPRGGRRVPIV